MMKKIVLSMTFVCHLAVLSAQNQQGQFSIKPMAGINVTEMNGGAINNLYHHKVRFTGGLEAEYGITPWLGVSLGAIYSQQGAKIDGRIENFYEDEENFYHLLIMETVGKLKSEYINFPLMANFYIPHVKGLAIKTGLQLGLLTGSKIDATVATLEIKEKRYDIPYITPYDPNKRKSTVIPFIQTDVCKSITSAFPSVFPTNIKTSYSMPATISV